MVLAKALRVTEHHVLPAVVSLIVAGLLWWGRTPPVEVLESEIVTPKVAPGGFFTIDRKLRSLRSDCWGAEVDGWLWDSLVPPHPHSLGTVYLGQSELARRGSNRAWQVPFAMPLGKACYVSRVIFSCFPFYSLWPIEMTLSDGEQCFEIVPPGP